MHNAAAVQQTLNSRNADNQKEKGNNTNKTNGSLDKNKQKKKKEKKLHSGASDSDIFPKTYINKTKLRSKTENMTTPN